MTLRPLLTASPRPLATALALTPLLLVRWHHSSQSHSSVSVLGGIISMDNNLIKVWIESPHVSCQIAQVASHPARSRR